MRKSLFPPILPLHYSTSLALIGSEKPVNEIKFSLPCKMNAVYTLTQLEWKGRTNLCRLWVVPHFPSGIIEWAKHERTWKSPNAKKGWRRGERNTRHYRQSLSLSRRVSPFSGGVIFTRARALLALLSLGKMRDYSYFVAVPWRALAVVIIRGGILR